MPDAMIELDISTPWEPGRAAGVPVGRRGRRRVAGVAGMLAVAVLVLGASAAGRGLAPVYHADFQVLTLDGAGGRFFMTRYPMGGGGRQVLEAVAAGDGRLLWRRDLGGGESFAAVTDRVVLLQSHEGDEGGDDGGGGLIALDAASGAERWERARARFAGLAGGRVLVEDRAWPREEVGFDPAYGDPEDPSVALPMLPHHERYLALEQPTGGVAWSVETPPGTLPSLDVRDYPEVLGLTDLDADGVLRVRDPVTGALRATYRLDARGPVARHQDGVPGQEVVFPAGGRGADVYDRASGRRLWHWDGPDAAYNGPYPCLGDRYCVFDGAGTAVLDAATGAPVRRIDRYAGLLDGAGERMVLYAQGIVGYHPNDVAAFAGPGAAVAWRLDGWFVAGGYGTARAPGGYFVWHPLGRTDSMVGRLDPRDGTVRVFGVADNFYGSPQCVATAGRVACLAIGAVYVWRLP
ncbi:PQQ-binding-like beta-propeller repeat protein [Dactylosporangium sp. CA-092794]|uniref:outer membrane protein assembly factor BamB family protein n=1 Tax=Dactylosporangium sp. CA-092794 TaxID=3239929 RepID=UPI003D8FB4B4